MNQAFTGNEILDRVKVADIVSALGVPLPRRGNRTRCPIHKGDNLTLSINEQKGVWHCFGCGEGGGKVQLVRRALNLEPRRSLEWIGGLAGMQLAYSDGAEYQKRAAQIKAAEQEGRRLIEWREDVIEYLKISREAVQVVYYWAIRNGASSVEAELWATIRDYDRRIQWHRETSWDVLVDVYQQAMDGTVKA